MHRRSHKSLSAFCVWSNRAPSIRSKESCPLPIFLYTSKSSSKQVMHNPPCKPVNNLPGALQRLTSKRATQPVGKVPRYPFEFLARGRFTKAVSISRSMLAGLMLRELKSPSEAAVNGLEASATCNKPRKIFGINLHAAIAHPVLVHVETYSLKYQVVCAKTRKQLSTSQRNPLINE